MREQNKRGASSNNRFGGRTENNRSGQGDYKHGNDRKEFKKPSDRKSFNDYEGENSFEKKSFKHDDNKSFAKKSFRDSSSKRSFSNDGANKRFNDRDGEKSFGNKRFNDRDGEKSFGNKRFNDRDGEKSFGNKRFNDRDGEKSFGNKRFNDRDGEKSFGNKRFNDSDNLPYERKPLVKKAYEGKNFRKDYKKLSKRGELDKPIDNRLRLNRFVSNAGICSRRDADKLILDGEITVNDKVITEMGYRVEANDKVCHNGKRIVAEQKVYLLLNKPKGFVTTLDDPHAERTVMELVENACSERIYPVGRLDKATTGLLLFTNDGDLAKKLTHPSYQQKKIYHVFLKDNFPPEYIEKIMAGIELEDGFVKADAVSYVDPLDKTQIGIEIHSGRNRIVRRIFEHFDFKVQKLDRVYLAGLTKKNLPRGKYRFLTSQEVNFLRMS
ncbi:MAG: pseudouridine synthase [Mangrovibacterium sp.]